MSSPSGRRRAVLEPVNNNVMEIDDNGSRSDDLNKSADSNEVRSEDVSVVRSLQKPSRSARRLTEYGRSNSVKKTRNRPFLTSSQLTDLFNRLDRNGDGSLDLDEFTDIVQMLQLQVTEEYITKIFLNFKKDTLSMQEFICAYQKVYSNQTVHDSSATQRHEEFIRATRYGVDEDGERLFEVYLIEKEKSPHQSSTESVKPARRIKFELQSERDAVFNVEDIFKSAKEEVWNGSVEDINAMIHKDSKANGDEGCRILWWIDVAMSHVEPSSLHKYVDTFGIPNNSKFLSNFGNFGNPLGKDPKSRFFLGNGVTVEGMISSMNVFIQTATLKDRPVVHHFPAWIENRMQSIQNSAFRYMKEYYMSRFAFVFNMSGLSNTNENERCVNYENAERLAKRLRDDVFDISNDFLEEETKEMNEKQVSSTLSAGTVVPELENSRTNSKLDVNCGLMESKGSGIPLFKRARHAALPTWIRSNAQLMKNRPSLKLDTLSMHVMDHGGGPNALITIRAIDDERASSKMSLEGRSRSGVLGRIVDAVWAKLLVINSADGAADIAGELDESPMTLMSFLTMMVHCYSMQSMSSLDYWLQAVETEIKDMAVSKHSSHVAEMSRITKEFKDYVDPLLTLLSEFLTEWEKETEVLMRAVADAVEGDGAVSHFSNTGGGGGGGGGRGDRSTHMRGSIFPTSGLANRGGGGGGGEKSPTSSASESGRRTSMRRSSRQVMMLSVLPKTPSVYANANSMMELEKLPLSYTVAKEFMGDACYRDLKIMLEGYELLELKGLISWKERIEKYEQRLSEMRTLIATQLDEKRNFTTFLLTIVTTVLAPLTILTGYFGMNFENMYELQPDQYPTFPGVVLMWAIAGLLYLLMFVLSMHFRVIYSAT